MLVKRSGKAATFFDSMLLRVGVLMPVDVFKAVGVPMEMRVTAVLLAPGGDCNP